MKDLWQKVKKEVTSLGGSVTGGRAGRWCNFNLESPDGYLWNATGDTEILAVQWRVGDTKGRQESVTDALARVRMGISKDEETY